MLQTTITNTMQMLNANDEEIQRFGLDKVPYEMFTLKHDPDKIDPIYYIKMLEHYNFNTEEVIYFEHNADAVKSAKSVGIITHHYDKDLKDLDALKKFFDENIV